MTRKNRKFRLATEFLEDRATPAQFGVPWIDPSHLTVSFAPDGTGALNEPSNLFGSLDSQMPRSEWQAVLLHAFETWSEVANVNFALVDDTGAAFGSPGLPQGDRRIGDIRIGSLPMNDVLAEAIPPDPTIIDSLAGDIFLNSHTGFDPVSLYAVALHEIGHALGLDSSEDPMSVMHEPYDVHTSLSASDISEIRQLYGARSQDANEGKTGNDNIKNATRIKFNSDFDGSAPLVIFGDVTSRADADYFYVPVLDTYTGPMTIRLRTSGISLLAPRLSVFDGKGSQIGSISGAGIDGDTVELTLPNVKPADKYYLKVEAAQGTSFSVGRYGLAVSFDDKLHVDEARIEQVMTGPYDGLSPRDLADLMLRPDSAKFNDDVKSNDTFGTATSLTPTPGFSQNSHYRVTASKGDSSDVDHYKFKAPNSGNGASVVLTGTVRAVDPNGAAQRISLYDSHEKPIPAMILANGNGTFTIQAIGLAPNDDYYVRVGDGEVGNYLLDLAFGVQPTHLTTFAEGVIPTDNDLGTTLYIAETQVFGFALTASGPAGTRVRFSIFDLVGNEVFSMIGLTGDTLSSVSGFLAPGEYRAQLSVLGGSVPVSFLLTGSSVTDPIGPQLSNSATAPLYQDPWNPEYFLYPTGTIAFDPYLFVYWSFE